MFQLYKVLWIVKLFCLYHCYKNKKDMFWYLVIIFLPFFGSLIYLVYHFVNKDNIQNVSEQIKTTVNKNYEFDKLLKEAKFTDTIANRIKLADTYASKQQYLQAISLYESCLQGFNSDDLMTKEKLMVAKYFIDDNEGVIALGDGLDKVSAFKNSESRIVYAWSLSFTDQKEKAEEIFKDMDIRFGNYVHRSEYAKFLIEEGRGPEAKELLLSLQEEINHMDPPEQRQKKPISKEIKSLLKSIV